MTGTVIVAAMRVQSWLIGLVVALLDVPHYDRDDEVEW